MLVDGPDPIQMPPLPARAVVCPTCVGPADMRSRHVIVDGSAIRIFCSLSCKERAGEAPPLPEPQVDEPPRRPPSPLVMGGLLVGCLFVADARPPAPPAPPPPPVAFIAPPPIVFVPAAPPKPSAEELLKTQWMTELMKDAWVHPLNGPARRMPIRDGRVFGAERPGERPIECQGGHCGVDIGGETWGEPVHAAHDGVVDRVQRGPNEEHGGQYVRLAHRGGTVFTQYFHLAAIPRWIDVGRPVRAGELVGLVGDTGVKSSGPHLHFTLSIKPAADEHERFIDPEPLIALWPLRIPDTDGVGGKLSASAEVPGAVRGALSRRAKVAKRAARHETVDAVEEPPRGEDVATEARVTTAPAL